MTPQLTLEQLGKCYRVTKTKRAKGPSESVTPWQRAKNWMTLKVGDAQDATSVRELWALKDLNLTVDPGIILGIVGPNGAGKSTLLKILARVTSPTTGVARGRGRVVSLLELGAGFDTDASARENIFVNAAMYGIPKHVVRGRFDQIIDFAGLGEFVDMPLRYFSSGMYLRLAFSSAINMDPDILLADEILAVGDIAFQQRCLRRVAEERDRGLTVLFVSHDMEAISRVSDRVIWLSKGELVRDGQPDEVVSEYQSAAWEAGDRTVEGAGATVLGQIVEVRLLNSERREVAAISRQEEAYIRVRFQTGPWNVPTRCSIDLYTRGVHVLRSAQKQAEVASANRVHELMMHIPAALLSETMYHVNVNCQFVKGGGKEQTAQQAKAMSFMVYGESHAAPRETGLQLKRGAVGVISPDLAWTPLREHSVVGVSQEAGTDAD